MGRGTAGPPPSPQAPLPTPFMRPGKAWAKGPRLPRLKKVRDRERGLGGESKGLCPLALSPKAAFYLLPNRFKAVRVRKGAGPQEFEEADHKQSRQKPAPEVGQGDAEVYSGFEIAVDLPQKPAVASQGGRVNDHVEGGHQGRLWC